MSTTHKHSPPTESHADFITAAVTSWPGATTAEGRFGSLVFHHGRRELGHLHGEHLADIPFPKAIRDRLIAEGRVTRHHYLPESGWSSRRIATREDAEDVVALFRMNYDRPRARAGAEEDDGAF
jgi:Family of unknown function (DUF5519)